MTRKDSIICTTIMVGCILSGVSVASDLNTSVENVFSISIGKYTTGHVHLSSVVNSRVRGNVNLNVDGETYINHTAGTGTRVHISVASIENSNVRSARISVSTDDVINLSTGNGRNCTIDIGTIKNANIGSIRQNIYIGGKIINLSIGAFGLSTPCEIRIGAIGK